MAIEAAQNRFLEILVGLEEREKFALLKWINSNWNTDSLRNVEKEELVLSCIAADLRPTLPFEAILPSETIVTPLLGPNADCDPKTTVHLDEFLYDDNYIEKLAEDGQISKYYCSRCFSRDVKLLTFISHSMSISRIIFLYKSMLPPLNNKEVILDVGSRLGGVLYGAYLMTSAARIIGVEMNSEFCKIQREIVQKYNFSDRIEIVCSNIFNRVDLLTSADVIILNNVFEFFMNIDECISSWRLLGENIKVGCIIVTIPHLCDTFTRLQIGFDWTEWVEELKTHKDTDDDYNDDTDNHLTQVKHYRVKRRILNNWNK